MAHNESSTWRDLGCSNWRCFSLKSLFSHHDELLIYAQMRCWRLFRCSRIIPFLVENPYQPSFVTVAERQVDRRSNMGYLPCSIFSALPGEFFLEPRLNARAAPVGIDVQEDVSITINDQLLKVADDEIVARHVMQVISYSKPAFLPLLIHFAGRFSCDEVLFQFWSSCVIHIWDYLFLMTSGQTTRLMVFGFSWSQNCLPISVILRLKRLIYNSPLDTEFEKPRSISKISKLYNCCIIAV